MRRVAFIPLLLGLLALAACGVGATSAQTGAPALTVSLPPTATPWPAPPTPTNVPTGWQVHTGYYLSVGYPSGWSESTIGHNPGPNAPRGTKDVTYEFTSPDSHITLQVSEEDHLDEATMQLNCGGIRQHATMAGIAMQEDSQPGDGRYSYGLYTTQGVGYGLTANLYPAGDQQRIDLVMQVFNTFRPVYTSPASVCS